jgi:hypothetical protein
MVENSCFQKTSNLSGLGGQFTLILILTSLWRERRIQNKSRVTVLVRIKEANRYSINGYKICLTPDYLNQIHARNFIFELGS